MCGTPERLYAELKCERTLFYNVRGGLNSDSTQAWEMVPCWNPQLSETYGSLTYSRSRL
jgi:hypothetical protein